MSEQAALAKRRGLLAIIRDGWNSVISGLGTDAYDKLSGNNAGIDYVPITYADAENLYGGDDLAAKIVDELPDEAFREGFELLTGEDKDNKIKKALLAKIELLDAGKRFEQAWKFARLYGGAGLLMVTDRLQDLALPLDENNIGDIRALQVLSRYELIANEIDLDIRSMTFGLPSSYRIQPRALAAPSAVNLVVHASRVIRFDGALIPRTQYVQNYYWMDSVLTRCQQALKNYNMSHNGVATALQDFSVATYKMKNLAEMIAGGDSNGVLTRMQTVALTRSIARAVVIDAENEGFEYQQRNMSGVPDVLESVGNRLVAGTKMPHTKLLGESPDGSNATGNSTTMQWYDYVKAEQIQYLKPKLMRLLTLICKSRRGPTRGVVPEGLDIHFRPLWQQDGKTQAETHYAQAQADNIYMTAGAVDPMEIAKSRFGSGKFSMETQIDMDVREGMDIDLSGHDESEDQETNPKAGPGPQTAAKKKDSMSTAIEPGKVGDPGGAVGTSAGNPIAGDLPDKVAAPGEEQQGGTASPGDDDEDEWAEMLGHLFDGMPSELAKFKDAFNGMAAPARKAVALKLMGKAPIHK